MGLQVFLSEANREYDAALVALRRIEDVAKQNQKDYSTVEAAFLDATSEHAQANQSANVAEQAMREAKNAHTEVDAAVLRKAADAKTARGRLEIEQETLKIRSTEMSEAQELHDVASERLVNARLYGNYHQNSSRP